MDPSVNSVGASTLVCAALTGEIPDGPVTLLPNNLGRVQRLLPVARHKFADDHEVAVLDLAGAP
ncbi:MAG: hypothetical protein Q8R44_04150 [Novosphingobium sp.]|nr:hypothetical protein [Novosphingobium sp.]